MNPEMGIRITVEGWIRAYLPDRGQSYWVYCRFWQTNGSSQLKVNADGSVYATAVKRPRGHALELKLK
jgi:hypothetical protein